MKHKSIFLALTGMTFSALTGCSLSSAVPSQADPASSNPQQSQAEQTEIERIFQMYRASGGELSYEEWLATVKGDSGKDGTSVRSGNGGSWATTKMASKAFVEEGNWPLNGDISGVANGTYIVHWFFCDVVYDIAKVDDADFTSVTYNDKSYSIRNVSAAWNASVIITALVVEDIG